MVGSEPNLSLMMEVEEEESPSPHGRVGTVWVVWGPTSEWGSPSPHGRVGTEVRARRVFMTLTIAVPSWSGRNLRSSSNNKQRPHLVTVPSWSGRNSTWKPIVELGRELSPSPHGRVGTCVFSHLRRCSRSKVAVPSWSGRNGS
jgi:hypothetical protein